MIFRLYSLATPPLLQWNTLHDQLLNRFVIEKSRDSILFVAIDSLPPLADTNSVHSYRYTDPGLLPGSTYYRLRLVDLYGNTGNSAVRSVVVPGAGGLTTIYPNPVPVGGLLYISSTVNCRKIRLMDVLGRLILEQDVQGYLQTLSPGILSRGIYLLIIDTDDGRQVQKVFVN